MPKKPSYKEVAEDLDACRAEVEEVLGRMRRLGPVEEELEQMKVNIRFLHRLVEVLVEALERRPKT